MKFGLYLAPFGELADPGRLSDLAIRAEERGFDGLFVWDHILRPQEGLPIADPWVALAAVATRTRRVALGPLVTPLSRRRPQKLARETVTLDQLSGGRLVLGVGLGVNSGGELSKFGEEDDDRVRGARLDEAIGLLRQFWSGEVVNHDGPHFRADGVQLLPRPVNGVVPVWVAARSPVPQVMRRASGCEGLCPLTTLDGLSQMLQMISDLRGGLDGFDVVARGSPGTSPAPWRENGASWWLVAVDPSTPAREIEAIIDDGPPLLSE